jgi:tyrosyl-tRNA synthetase
MGGSDQWGNITGGGELIRKKLDKDAFALTTGLLTKTDGGKFGKSEEGNIWLHPNLTSPYKFYQFWLNVEDAQIGKLLRIFTLLGRHEIEELENNFSNNPNALKRILAEHVTIQVHSYDIFKQVEKASNLLFGSSTLIDFENTDENILQDIFTGLISANFDNLYYNSATVDRIVSDIFEISKGEARRLIAGNGISINKEKITTGTIPVNNFGLLKESYLLIQKGKTYGIAKFIQ